MTNELFYDSLEYAKELQKRQLANTGWLHDDGPDLTLITQSVAGIHPTTTRSRSGLVWRLVSYRGTNNADR